MRDTSRVRSLCSLALAALLAAAAWSSPPAYAQDDLYGPGTPADVTWVRGVNAEASGGLGIRVADGPLLSVAWGDATPYRPVSPGQVELDLGGTILSIEVEAGAFLSVVATGDEPLVIVDTALVDVSRGLLSLYNLTRIEALDLRAADGTSVISDVAPGTHAAVIIAEAEVALEVSSGDEVLGALEARLYERGVAHSVMVVEGPDGPHVRYVAAVASE